MARDTFSQLHSAHEQLVDLKRSRIADSRFRIPRAKPKWNPEEIGASPKSKSLASEASDGPYIAPLGNESHTRGKKKRRRSLLVAVSDQYR